MRARRLSKRSLPEGKETYIEARVRSVVQGIRQAAIERRLISPHDPIPDAFDHCAALVQRALDDTAHLEDLLTPAEVSVILRRSPSQVRRMCRSGAMPSSRVGRDYRIRRGDAQAFLEGSMDAPVAVETRAEAPASSEAV